jgi:inorganic phosphate transporter, PiT family
MHGSEARPARRCLDARPRFTGVLQMTTALLLGAAVFAVASGVNDGGALVALGLKVPGVRPGSAIIVLALAIVVSPLVFGTAVATTVAHKLVPFHGPDGRMAVLLAIVGCLAVVAVLARLHLPTSLTLATIGALVGAGLGFGFTVSWPTIGVVIAVGLVAPIVGAFLATVVSYAVGMAPVPIGPRTIRLMHLGTFGLESLAYGANDGQRMLAMFSIAGATVATGAPRVHAHPWELLVIPLCFVGGALVGMYRYAGTFGTDLVPARPHHTPIAELAASAASFGGMSVGSPLSTTQAASAGLVGAAGPEHWLQVRWRRTARLALAWVLTVPSAFAVGLLLGVGGSAVR